MKKLEKIEKIHRIPTNQLIAITGGRKKSNDEYRFYSTCEQTTDQIVEITHDNGLITVYKEECDDFEVATM